MRFSELGVSAAEESTSFVGLSRYRRPIAKEILLPDATVTEAVVSRRPWGSAPPSVACPLRVYLL